MATGNQVLSMLLPEGGWVIVGDNYDGISFMECDPISQEEFEAGFAKFDAWEAEQIAIKAEAKAALLERLGITAEEATLLLG